MGQVGVTVTASEVPQSTTTVYNTANGFMVGFADSGSVNSPVQCTSLAQVASVFGTPAGTGNPYSSRTSTCANVFDAADAYFNEGGEVLWVSRVAHGTPVAASLVLQDGSAGTSLTVTAQYVGAGGNGVYVVVQNNTSTFTLTLQDANGNVLAGPSAALSTKAAGVAWFATTGYATAVAGAGTLPATLTATALAGGNDNHSSATLADWQTALAAFLPGLGPGQVFAPGNTNTNLNGIWAALGSHAQQNNRVAVCDMDDNTAAATLAASMSSINTTGVASYQQFWAGNRNLPGITPGTTRSISPSPVIAAKDALTDLNGNPNRAAAGPNFACTYANSATSLVTGLFDTYSSTDLNTLNAAGVNTFADKFGVSEPYGLVSAVLPTSDGVYWQFRAARMRMALIAESQIIGEKYIFSQIDGAGADALALSTDLQAMLTAYYKRGALFGTTADEAFTVDVGPTVNTPATEQAGQLNANLAVRLSPGAQQVNIRINIVPVTQSL